MKGRSVLKYFFVFALLAAFLAPCAVLAATDSRVTVNISPSSCSYAGEVDISISAPGAKQLQLYYNGRRDIRVDGDTYEETWVIYEDVEIFAYAEFEDGWSGPSAPDSVDCVPSGSLSPIALTMTSSAKAGEEVEIAWTKLDNLVRYTLNVLRKENGNRTYVYTAWQDADATSATLAPMTPGTYEVIVEAWDANGKSSKASKTLTVNAQTVPDAPVVTVDKSSVMVGEDVYFTVTAPGAETIRTQFGRNIGYDWEHEADGDITELSFVFNVGGLFDAAFSVCVDGIWSPYCAPLPITVEQLGTLDAPQVVLPDQITAGEDLTISWDAVENAQSYWIALYTMDDHGNSNYVEGFRTTSETYTIPGRYIAAGRGAINIYSERAGYQDGEAWVEFAAVPAASDYKYRISGGEAVITGYIGGDRIVTVPEELGGCPVTEIDESAFGGRMITRVILPESVRWIGAHAFEDCAQLERIDIPRNTHVHKYAFSDCDSLTVYGYTGSAAQYAAEYSGCDFVSTGTPAAAPTVEVGETELLINEYTELTITAPGATMLRVRNSDYWDVDDYEPDGDETVIGLDFYDPGRFTVSVSALIDGNWTQYSEPIVFTVTSLGKLGNPTMTLPEEIVAGQDLTITFTGVENAQEYCLIYSMYDESTGYYEYVTQEDVSANRSSITIEGRYIRSGEGELILYARADGWEDGEATEFFEAEASEYDYTYEIQDEKVTITGYIGSSKEIVIPEEIEEYPVICIGYDAFAYSDITSVSLPDTLERIDSWAFGECISLRRIDIGPGVMVNESAFKFSENLTVYGYTGSSAEYAAEMCECGFVSIGTLKEGPELSASQTEIRIGDVVEFEFSVQGATQIAVRNSDYSYLDIYEIDDTSSFFTEYFYEEGTYFISIAVLIDGEWTQFSEPVEIVVTSNGKLDAPVVTFPQVITAGEDLTISWEAVENAEEYYIGLGIGHVDNRLCYVFGDYTDQPAVTIPGENIPAGGAILYMEAEAEGWESGSKKYDLFIQPGAVDYFYTIEDGEAVITSYVGGDENIVIPDTLGGAPVVGIEREAFRSRYFTSITLPSSLEWIEDWAFSACRSLKRIVIPAEVEVSLNAFDECAHLTVYGYTGSSAQEAAEYCECTFIALDDLPDGDLTIALRAAQTAAAPGKTIRLTKTITPAGMEDIYAFTFASGDTQIATVSSTGLVTMLKPGFVTVTLTADDPLATSASILLECTGSHVYVMPDELGILSDEALRGTPVQAVVLGEDIASIGTYALADCGELYKVVIPAASCSIDENAFDGSEGVAIVAPQGSAAQTYAQEHDLAFYPLEESDR